MLLPFSGPTAEPPTYGSMLELAWAGPGNGPGSKTIQLNGGIERKFLKDGDIFIKRIPKKKNIVEELHGAILHLYICGKVIIIDGYFKNDNLNIIKNNCRYKNKLLKLEKLLKRLNLTYLLWNLTLR